MLYLKKKSDLDKSDTRYHFQRELDDYRMSELKNYGVPSRKPNYDRVRKIFFTELDKHKIGADVDELDWQK